MPIVADVNFGITSFLVTNCIRSDEIPFDSFPRRIIPFLPDLLEYMDSPSSNAP
jgi:hypothetical protein